jgi:hypothetical protein
MTPAGRNTLLLVAFLGWGIAGFAAWALVARVGWIGVGLIGGAVLFVALRVELDDEFPGSGIGAAHLMRVQLEQAQGGSPETRLARLARRAERNRWLYLLRTIGIALLVMGGGMFALHQI